MNPLEHVLEFIYPALRVEDQQKKRDSLQILCLCVNVPVFILILKKINIIFVILTLSHKFLLLLFAKSMSQFRIKL